MELARIYGNNLFAVMRFKLTSQAIADLTKPVVQPQSRPTKSALPLTLNQAKQTLLKTNNNKVKDLCLQYLN
jgi:hypothetical protein